MIKATLAFLVLTFSTLAAADICTVVIRDQYGYEYDSFSRSSYSSTAACDDANWDCRQKLSMYQSVGQHYNSMCSVVDIISSYPTPLPPSYPRYPDYPREPSYPRYPDYPRQPSYPREPSYPRQPSYPREPHYPRPRDPREPPRHEPGSEPRRPGPGPHRPGPGPRPRVINVLEVEN